MYDKVSISFVFSRLSMALARDSEMRGTRASSINFKMSLCFSIFMYNGARAIVDDQLSSVTRSTPSKEDRPKIRDSR